MKATLKTVALTLALALGLTVRPAVTLAEDAKPPQNPEDFLKALAEAGKPGAEHKKLQPLAGSWNYTAKFWMDPSKSPLESKGTIERQWILGGRFLEEKVAGTGFDGKPGFEGRGLLGYDNGLKKYTYSWACSMGTGTSAGLGAADTTGAKLTFQTEAYCPVMKKTIKGREEIRIESEDKVVMESYMIEDGKEIKVMELVSTRKR